MTRIVLVCCLSLAISAGGCSKKKTLGSNSPLPAPSTKSAPVKSASPKPKSLPLMRARKGPLRLISAAFSPGESMPMRLTCEGAKESPPLSWTGVPKGTKSLALLIEDPDAPDPKAPKMTWVHWVLYNIPPRVSGLTGNAAQIGLPTKIKEGVNSWQLRTYGAPCPPIGRHRYLHKLYALDIELSKLHRPTRDDLIVAMEGHVLTSATLTGTYAKQNAPIPDKKEKASSSEVAP